METKSSCELAADIRPQGIDDQRRPEIRPADADIDDVPDALAGRPLEGAVAHLVGKITQRIEFLLDQRRHAPPSIAKGKPRPPWAAGARSAICKAGRSSVLLIRAPSNRSLARSAVKISLLWASPNSRPMVTSVTPFLE